MLWLAAVFYKYTRLYFLALYQTIIMSYLMYVKASHYAFIYNNLSAKSGEITLLQYLLI